MFGDFNGAFAIGHAGISKHREFCFQPVVIVKTVGVGHADRQKVFVRKNKTVIISYVVILKHERPDGIGSLAPQRGGTAIPL